MLRSSALGASESSDLLRHGSRVTLQFFARQRVIVRGLRQRCTIFFKETLETMGTINQPAVAPELVSTAFEDSFAESERINGCFARHATCSRRMASSAWSRTLSSSALASSPKFLQNLR